MRREVIMVVSHGLLARQREREGRRRERPEGGRDGDLTLTKLGLLIWTASVYHSLGLKACLKCTTSDLAVLPVCKARQKKGPSKKPSMPWPSEVTKVKSLGLYSRSDPNLPMQIWVMKQKPLLKGHLAHPSQMMPPIEPERAKTVAGSDPRTSPRTASIAEATRRRQQRFFCLRMAASPGRPASASDPRYS